MMEKKLKVAIFKLDSDDFEKYYNQRLIEQGCSVFSISDFFYYDTRSQKDKLIIKKILALRLKKFDLIVVFDNYKIIPFIRMKMKCNAKLILWNWNKQSSQKAQREKLVSLFCNIWTFDSNDAEKYNWKLNNQFYIPITNLNANSSRHIRAFCACLDKGRYPLMQKIREQLMANDIECDFILVKDGSSNYDSQDSEWIKEEGMPYDAFLQHTLDSDIVIELVQSGQSGLTIRSLEAMFYGKKLITNNVAIKQVPFYLESNIFIYGHDDESKLKEFLEQPYTEISNEIKEQYLIDRWVQNFIKETSYEKSTIN